MDEDGPAALKVRMMMRLTAAASVLLPPAASDTEREPGCRLRQHI